MAKRDFNNWISGFRGSIADYRYYIDFEKVHRNVNSIKVELNILNSLIGSNNIERDFEDLIKKNILLENAEKRMDEITNYNDLELMNPETLAHVLNAQDLLRSVLILADEETTQAIISTIEDILKSAKETNLSINIKLICQILEEVIKRIPEDKTIPQIVSFGRI